MMPIRSSLKLITSLTLAFVSSIFGLAGVAEWQEISSPNGAYDQGIAFRYVIAKQNDVSEIRIDAEATESSFGKDHDVWAVTSAQGKYS